MVLEMLIKDILYNTTNKAEQKVWNLFTDQKYLNSAWQIPAALSAVVAAVSFPAAIWRQKYEAWLPADCYFQAVFVVPGSGLGFHSPFLV